MAYRWNRNLPRAALRRLAPVWVFCLVVASLLPGNFKMVIGSTRLRDQGQARAAAETGEIKHRSYHFLSFGATALLFLGLATTRREEALAAAGTVALGLAIEFAQRVLYLQKVEWDDVRDDTYSIAVVYLAITAIGLYGSWRQRRTALSQRT